MDRGTLEWLIDQGEGYNLEFKESFSQSISKEICAFANANGGKILLGVSDKGEIKGIKEGNDLKSRIQDIARNLDPTVKISLAYREKVLLIDVPEGSNKPYSTNGKFFMRVGPNSQQLTRDEIREFFQKEGLILFDEKINPDFNIEKDLSKDDFEVFLKRAKISPLMNKENILENLEILKEGHLRNAGVLLFCKKVSGFLRNATITCAFFQGKDKYKILDSKEFDGSLYSNYQHAVNYILSKVNTEYVIGGGARDEIPELPEKALREAILNAIAHRNYFLRSNIQIYIFSDRVEITNPGGLVPGMTVSDLGKKSMPRNFLLFGLMQRMELVEKIGSGILRINREMEEYGLEPPNIEVNDNWFTIIFKRPDLQKESFEDRTRQETAGKDSGRWYEKWCEKWYERGLSEREIEILVQIEKNPGISIKRLSRTIGINPSAIQRHINKLKNKGILRRVGPAKGGRWEVVEDEE